MRRFFLFPACPFGRCRRERDGPDRTCTGEARFAFFRSRLSDLAEQAAFWRFYKQYLSVMAAPHQLIPKICETDYRLLESGRKLGEYVRRFSTLAFAGSIPLGRAQQTQLDLIPRPEMIELWDNLPRWREMSNSDGQGQVAPAAYFCITKCRVEDGSRRWNPGVRSPTSIWSD